MGLILYQRGRPGQGLGSVDVNIPADIGAGLTAAAAGFTVAGMMAAGASFGTMLGPIGAGVGAVVGLLMSFLHAGYNPRKLNDTAVTEAVQLAMHQTWYQLTGEDLGGVANPCTPGQCGAQHVAIFTDTAYPNVPLGPLGNPQADLDSLIPQVRSLIAEGRARLVRPESYYYYDMNTNYMLDRFQQVADARAAAGGAAGSLLASFGSLFPPGIDWKTLGLLGVLGYAAYAIL